MSEYGPKAEEAAFRAFNTRVLDKWTWVLPVAESDAIVVWSTCGGYLRGFKLGVSGHLPPRSRATPKIIRPVMVMTLMELQDAVNYIYVVSQIFSVAYTEINSASP